MALDEKGDHGKVAESSVDIVNFVQEVHHFSALVEPLECLWTLVRDIRQWKSPNTTLTVWLICNIAGLVLTKGAVFVLVALTIFFISGVSLFHVHTRILDKFLPLTSEESEEDVVVVQSDNMADTMQSVREFRTSLIQMYVILEQFNQRLIGFYSLLKWDDMTESLKFHIGICFSMLCLCVLPTRWNFLLFSNWLLLCDRKVHTYLKNHGLNKLQTFIQEKSGLDLVIHYGSVSSGEKNTPVTEKPVSDVGGTTHVIDSHDKDDMSLSEGEYEVGTCSSESGNDSDSRLDSTPSKPGMVSRILEFKRRKQQMMTGQCHGCKTSFASILKRRYCCMQCGNHFCARCCSQKLPRSMFGATAPAAQTETVPVCGACFTLLSSKEGKAS